MADIDIGQVAGGGAVGGVLTVAGLWIRRLMTRDKSEADKHTATESRRVADATAAATVKVARVQAEVSVSEQLLGRIDRLEQRTDELRELHDECEDNRRKDREHYEEQRRRDREACDEEISAIRSDLRDVAARALKERMESIPREQWEQDTGVHVLAEIATRPDSRPEVPLPPPLPRESEGE